MILSQVIQPMLYVLSWQRSIQVLVLLAAVVAAFIIGGTRPSTIPETTDSSFDMLGYIDAGIAKQEDCKDVRCWSSVNKIQMFISGISIEHAAIGTRVERYVELIQDTWQDASQQCTDTEISKETLVATLARRFPHSTDPATKKVGFDFDGQAELITISPEAVTDYSDTIEAWRLLQTWAVRQTDATGRVNLSPGFSREAIDAFRDFLVVYDIALLKHAKEIAHQQKRSKVDVDIMNLAFRQQDPAQEL